MSPALHPEFPKAAYRKENTVGDGFIYPPAEESAFGLKIDLETLHAMFNAMH